ncbi:MAG: glycosyltransferase family 39 protein [Flavobacteriales bacterium]|nr:glycosyltransferase family 39 protein [Flavobacteriales bacterium]
MLRRHRFALLLILLYALIGVSVYSDYGISWDEPTQHEYGKVVWQYVFNGNQALHEHGSRYHGPVFQALLYAMELVSETTASPFELRHLITFLFSVVGAWFFYLLLLRFKFSSYWAAVGLLFLLVSPRIFAHSFYNSKDATFMYLFIIAVYTMIRFLKRPTLWIAVWHGLICGLLIDVRILGLFVPMITGLLWVGRVVNDRPHLRTSLPPMFIFGMIATLSMIAFWPTLWHAPIEEFQNALAKMSDYPWDDPVLFEGTFSQPGDLPWYYLPKWMLITTPIFISAMMVVGMLSWFFNHRLTLSEKSVPLLWVALPFGLILWKEATVYDGWRHVFFLYPAMLIVATYGAQQLFEKGPMSRKVRWFVPILLLFPIYSMVQSHPFQYVYFNPLVKKVAWSGYEMDYWGVSYKQVLEALVAQVPEGELKVCTANAPGHHNSRMLQVNERERILYLNCETADYFVSNFRFPHEHNAFEKRFGFYSDPLQIIEVDGNPIVGVFRLKND